MMEIVLLPGLLSAGVGALDLRGARQPDGIRLVLADRGPLPHVGSPTGHPSSSGPSSSASASAFDRHWHLHGSASCAASVRAAPEDPADARGRLGGRRTGRRLCRRDDPRLVRSAVLGPVGLACAGPAGGRVDRGRPAPADRVQGARLCHLAERVPRAVRSSRACSSALRVASPCRTSAACPWSRARPWASGRWWPGRCECP